jgi:hypothetical protein
MSAIYVVSMAISHDDDRSCSLIDHDNHLHSIGPLSGFQDAMQVVIAEKLPMRLRINPDNMSPNHIYLFVTRVCMFVTPQAIDIQR